MATLSQVVASPREYAGKALSIIRHQSLKLVGRVRGLRFKLADALTRPVTVDIGDGVHAKFVASSQRSLGRARKTLTKEPGTTDWVLGFEPDTVMWDIGANIGTYTLMAALRRNSRVLAFEPMVATYRDLVMNIAANGLGERVGGFCLAFTDKDGIDNFYIRNEDAGYSGNTFGQPVDQYGNPYAHTNTYQVLGLSVDSFVDHFDLEIPDYIKIDVDGGEMAILNGATATFANPKVKSILIELEESMPGRVDEALAVFLNAGFKLGRRDVLIDLPNEKTANYIFVR